MKIDLPQIVEELRSKARYFEKTGLIPTLDACMSVVKSDSLISTELHSRLLQGFNKLIFDQSEAPDWHPGTNDMVLDLVHPSMYPLVYGNSKVFEEEQVGIENAIQTWSGKGQNIEKDKYGEWRWDTKRKDWGYSGPDVAFEDDCWNDTYQWLPANVAFEDDGMVKITSYINNLHPRRYAPLYSTIEKLIEAALPAWDQCLVPTDENNWEPDDEDYPGGAGRLASRFEFPEDAE